MHHYETEIQHHNKYLYSFAFGECGYRPDYSGTFPESNYRDEKFFGDNLFRDWRYNPDGSLNKDFVLNNPTYSGQILVAGKNFGSTPVVNMLHGLLPDMAFA